MFEPIIVQHGPWSISKLGTLQKCSLQYNYKYIQKAEEESPFTETKIGLVVHEVLEHSIKGDPNFAGLLTQAMEKHALDTSERATILTKHSFSLETFLVNLKKFIDEKKIIEIGTEHKWGMTADFKSCGFFDSNVFFRGVVDLWMRTEENDLVIMDHKSGKVRPIHYNEAQLRAYELLSTINYPKIRGVQCVVNYTLHDKRIWTGYVPRSRILRENKEWLVNELNKQAPALIAKPSGSVGWWCPWCSFKSTCPVYIPTDKNDETKE